MSSTRAGISKGWGVAGLAVAMTLIGAGGGGFRVVIVPFMIDQHDRLQSGVHGINDDELTVQFICSLYFWWVRLACFFTMANTMTGSAMLDRYRGLPQST